jgi:multidrug efflux pump subunit AcrA (membrane-fusion protein)
MKKMLTLLPIFIFLSIFTVQCGKKPPEERASSQSVSRAVTQVSVADVKEGPIFKAYVAVGTVAPWDLARITPKVAGFVISDGWTHT